MFFLPHFLVYTLASPHSLSLSLSSILRQQGNHDHLIIQFNGLVALTDRCSALAFLGPLQLFYLYSPSLSIYLFFFRTGRHYRINIFGHTDFSIFIEKLVLFRYAC